MTTREQCRVDEARYKAKHPDRWAATQARSRAKRRDARDARRAAQHAEHDAAQIPSLPGYLADKSGTIWTTRGKLEPQPLKASAGPCGFRTVYVAVHHKQETRRVGPLVLETWEGPAPKGGVVRHLDGYLGNDQLGNLAYGTEADIVADEAARGVREHLTMADPCPAGDHAYGSVRWTGGFGSRYCGTCNRRADRQRRPPRAVA